MMDLRPLCNEERNKVEIAKALVSCIRLSLFPFGHIFHDAKQFGDAYTYSEIKSIEKRIH